MNLRNFSRYSAANPHLIDDLIDTYVTWREECSAVSIAYATWLKATPDARDEAYAVYVATVDREEQAAAEYRLLVERLQSMPQTRVPDSQMNCGTA